MTVSVESRSGKYRRGERSISLLVVALLVLMAPGTARAQNAGSRDWQGTVAEGAQGIGFDTCGPYTGHVVYTKHITCVGEVPSFDGVELEGRIVFPCPDPDREQPCTAEELGSEPFPFVVMFHGWPGNREYTYGDGRQGNNDWGKATSAWEPARFLEKGYAVLAYTARGFAASCGPFDVVFDVLADGGTGPVDSVLDALGDGGKSPHQEDPAGCVDGHTHIAERDYEVEDTKYLLGLLVDAGVADPDRLVAAGSSYGGAQTWMLATSMPWPTLGGRELQLAGAVAFDGWTDLFDALAPNGRATDSVDQSRSTEVPFGVHKQSIFQHLYRVGRVTLPLIGENPFPTFTLAGARYNTTKPDELHSFIDGWMAVFSAGEPHASPQALALPEELRGKSAFYDEEGYLAALSRREIKPVPIFTVQGWTDVVFPAVQSLKMYRKLKAAHPGYPISMVLGDLGHTSQKTVDQVAFWMERATAFIDAVMTGSESERVVASFPTSCPLAEQPPVVAGNWDALQGKIVSFESSQDASTDSLTSDVAEESATDPLLTNYLYKADHVPSSDPSNPLHPLRGALGADHPTCVTRDQADSASGATWRFPEDPEDPEDAESSLSAPLTMLGLPRVSLDYALAGEDASVMAKLWDVGTDGEKMLVTRGVYRLSTAAGDPQSGTISFQLFGNHWTFPPGHKLELEIGQRDAPFLRPNNLQSSLDISRISLEVPTANE